MGYKKKNDKNSIYLLYMYDIEFLLVGPQERDW